MKPITTSVFTFADLIDGGYVYVDKTARLYDLVRPYKGVYFLSRPRRFGKSQTISTLEAVFQGRRGLFRGLAIDATDYDWKPYPVIRIDLGGKQDPFRWAGSSTRANLPTTGSRPVRLAS